MNFLKYLILFISLVLVGCNPKGKASETTQKDQSATILTSISISPSEFNLKLGEQYQFIATGTYSNNSTRDITSSVIWHSSNHQSATIEPKTGLATGIAEGSSQIVAILGETHSSVSNLNVTAKHEVVELKKIQINVPISKLFVGQETQFRANGIYSNDEERDITNEVEWSSSTPSIVSITSGGVTFGILPGEAQITASLGSIYSEPFTISIEETQITQINISPNNTKVFVDNEQQFNAIAIYSDKQEKDVTKEVKWKSSKPEILTIDESNGLAKGLKPGTTEISASLGSITSQNILFEVVLPQLDFSVISSSCNTIRVGVGGISITLRNDDSEIGFCYLHTAVLHAANIVCDNPKTFWHLEPGVTKKTISCSPWISPSAGVPYTISVYCMNKYSEYAEKSVLGKCT